METAIMAIRVALLILVTGAFAALWSGDHPDQIAAAGQPAKNTDQIDALLEEIVDRFGKLPPQAQTLIDVHRLRVIAKPYGLVKVDAAPGVITITFQKNPPIDSMKIIQLIQKHKNIKLAGNEKLRIERELPEAKDRAQMVRDILKSLGQPVVVAAVAAAAK